MIDYYNEPNSQLHDLLVISFAQARLVASSIRADGLHALQPLARIGAERLLRAIATRRLFDDETMIEIEVLIERITALIEAETEVIDCWDNDPHNVSGLTSWTELRRSKHADALLQTVQALRSLEVCISAVIDCRNARAEVF